MKVFDNFGDSLEVIKKDGVFKFRIEYDSSETLDLMFSEESFEILLQQMNKAKGDKK